MKNLLLALNIVLLSAVGFLFYKQYSGNGGTDNKNKTVVASNSSQPVNASRMAWINMDSLQNNYEYFKEKKSSFEKEQQAGNADLEMYQHKYEQELAELQQKAPTMTPQQQEAASKRYAEIQRDLGIKKQNLDNQLYQSSSRMKDSIYKKVQDFLADYNKEKHFNYVFSYEPALIVYRDSTLDITNDVIDGLNQAYKKEKK
ncbi:OmpH family outer membrane protein [Ferruginibacter albus]|uniref:OmpH family outer membrane protein n=1 Tax=Ferruginibacter albus TaxID=2875540 RepID=UPI001CC6061F|nr:OmpH family outer membrane protein [Ferruginibacter albus]UAY50835.1 OmpH family outer membrane protein [Ferruginibacter albus]